MANSKLQNKETLSFEDFKKEVLNDYKTAVLSRECSLLGRREVLTGKAKFGIFGDGKELPQIAMAKYFKEGDFRSGYYRDQTFMFAIGALTPQEFFASLYADANPKNEPSSAGRQMNGHFATHLLNDDGSFKKLKNLKNVSADISPTAGQMPRLLGLAQASKIYRNVKEIGDNNFSENGNEIAFGTIGNASTSEGHFFEVINAAGVLQVPMVISVWDDEYGISVHAKYQTTKESISEILKGFQRTEDANGYEIFVVEGWNYTQLMDTYNKASKIARKEHVPVLIHVKELTQPQGHSTSGSHERYKSKERLQWEKEHDCNAKFRDWILNFELQNGEEILKFISSEKELLEIEKNAKKEASSAKREAWNNYLNSIKKDRDFFVNILNKVNNQSNNKAFIKPILNNLENETIIDKGFILNAARKILHIIKEENLSSKTELKDAISNYLKNQEYKYGAHLYSEHDNKATNVKEILPTYNEGNKLVDARIIIRDNFKELFAKHKDLLIFGEDSGKIGDVNQGLEGLQDLFGEFRVSDTGIREASIIGQGIGLAMRGLRPIAEIQYLDYVLYGLQTMSDDLATLRWRTFGKQKAPLIIRTRGHRLEGVWHSGSPMGLLLSSLRGIYILTPRNMTKASGFYNTLLKTDEPAIIIENLNGYRLKEKLPNNLTEYCTPIGIIETIKEGNDITVVSYGSTLRIVEQAAIELQKTGIEVEVIDAQTLLPFDINHDVVKSIKKTNRLLIVDEDIPGGASAYLLDEILNKQNAYKYLDSKPETLTAKSHRPAYGSDGDYFSKPNMLDIYEKIYKIMHEVDPNKYPAIY
jgi:pyruvate/2-oxoglutarate/acetoin dehydrogenase E1 component/TPP-dependent pyruvate/acetoin dehydrogenase alpha subunit